MGRAPCCQKVGLKRGRWTAEEDQILIKYIQDHGEGSWRSLPKNAGLMRCGKSCRLRWINYLRKDLKRGNISPQEEDLIIKLHAALGNRWSLIASQLPGRTDNEIKNRWNSHLSRSITSWRRPVNDTLPQQILDNLAKLMAKPNPSTKKKGSKKNGPANKETRDKPVTLEDDNNDKPQTPDVHKESLPTNSCSQQSLQSILSLEDRYEAEEGEMDMDLGPVDDYGGVLSLSDMVTPSDPSTMMHQPLSPNEILSPGALYPEFMNELAGLSTGHAEMGSTSSWLPNCSTSTMDNTTQPSLSSPSSPFTIDHLLNISSDWNWEDCVQTPNDQDLIMNHEVGSFDNLSWLWDDGGEFGAV
uniref:Uncharacterized protein n=3 Tax=Kalanchoe fedtschenkoi TaxID=63787 RepID=A0A7N0RBY2_KALFE